MHTTGIPAAVTPIAPSGAHGIPARTPYWISSVVVGGSIVVIGGPMVVGGGGVVVTVVVVGLGEVVVVRSTVDVVVAVVVVTVVVVVVAAMVVRGGMGTSGVAATPCGPPVGMPAKAPISRARPSTAPTPATASRCARLLRHHQPRTGPGAKDPSMGMSPWGDGC
jgi:hypothetical protein